MHSATPYNTRTRSTLKSFTLLFVGCILLGSMLLLPHEAHAATRTETKPLPGFPTNAAWVWEGRFIQAWLGPLENDAQSGDHVNLHIQPLGGADPETNPEYADYHITYNGIVKNAEGESVYEWNIYDSVKKTSDTVEESASLGPDDAAAYAVNSMAEYISDDATDVNPADLQALEAAIQSTIVTEEESPFVQSFLDLLESAA